MANCCIKIVFSKGTYHAVLAAARDIQADEELYFDYNMGKDLDWLKEYHKKFILKDSKKSGKNVQHKE
jgi:SET domain-containing protein